MEEYHVVLAQDALWALTSDGKTLAKHRTRNEAQADGAARCRNLSKRGVGSRLFIHNSDGSIATEYEYNYKPRSAT